MRVAAIGAVAQLAGEQQAEAVKPYIQQCAQGAEETVARAANKALQKLEGRLSPSGRYTATANVGSTAATATPTPGPLTTTAAPPTATRTATTTGAAARLGYDVRDIDGPNAARR